MPLALKDPWQQVGGGQLSRQGSAAGAASNGAPTANNVASAKEKEATKQQVRGKKINSPHFRFFPLRHLQIRVPDPASSGVSDTDEDPDSSRSQENDVRD